VRVFYFCPMTDYILVGGGLAGMAFAQTAWQNGKSVAIYDGLTAGASRIASGLYNPVVLKRLNAVADASEYLQSMEAFYPKVDDRLQIRSYFPLPLLRRFASVEEQNNWFEGCDQPRLQSYLSAEIVRDVHGIDGPFGFGKVLHTGWLDTKKLLDEFWQHIPAGSRYIKESFDHSLLNITKEQVTYKSTTARHLVFAEGFTLSSNPYFNYLPLQGTKGELLHIKAPGLDMECAVKGGVFILPMGDDKYKVGATYAWDDKTEIPTDAARTELIEKLDELIRVPYEIIDHKAGIRPTVKDRKPLLGTHSSFPRVHILNGLGTRGILLAPRLAQLLYDWIEKELPLPAQVDISRFSSDSVRTC
jgi:glycine oxidase